jgi:NAD-dependent dihydropyrimidine dehydrogenase PreA subunit
MTTITIDSALCVGCQWCAIICPEEVFDIHNDVVCVVVNLDNCTLCNKCQDEQGCPEAAITVESG